MHAAVVHIKLSIRRNIVVDAGVKVVEWVAGLAGILDASVDSPGNTLALEVLSALLVEGTHEHVPHVSPGFHVALPLLGLFLPFSSLLSAFLTLPVDLGPVCLLGLLLLFVELVKESLGLLVSFVLNP